MCYFVARRTKRTNYQPTHVVHINMFRLYVIIIHIHSYIATKHYMICIDILWNSMNQHSTIIYPDATHGAQPYLPMYIWAMFGVSM